MKPRRLRSSRDLREGRKGPGELIVDSLSVEISRPAGAPLAPIQSVSFSVPAGSITCLVGESGSGKSMLGRTIAGLLPPNVSISHGNVVLDGKDLAGLSERDWYKVRGSSVSMVFQNPKSSLNPLLKVGNQLCEVLRANGTASRSSAMKQAEGLLVAMGISEAGVRLHHYPHQLSGGMAQRVALALAMACEPSLLIADEPTTGLDMTVQEQVIELMLSKVRAKGTSLLLITHDIGLAQEIADHVVVMYAGTVMELGNSGAVLGNPVHPYTIELLRSARDYRGPRMYALDGHAPTVLNVHEGCAFADRCHHVVDECRDEVPMLTSFGDSSAACHRIGEIS